MKSMKLDGSNTDAGMLVAATVEILFGVYAFVEGMVHDFYGIGGLISFSGQDHPIPYIPHPLGHTFTLEGLILLVAGVAVWKGQRWGWSLSVGVTMAGTITSIFALSIGSVGALQPLVMNLGLLCFFLLDRRRRRFAATR